EIAGHKDVVVGAAVELVDAIATDEDVASGAAGDQIVAGFALKHIRSAAAGDGVVSESAEDVGRAGYPRADRDLVVAILPEDHDRAGERERALVRAVDGHLRLALAGANLIDRDHIGRAGAEDLQGGLRAVG